MLAQFLYYVYALVLFNTVLYYYLGDFFGLHMYIIRKYWTIDTTGSGHPHC